MVGINGIGIFAVLLAVQFCQQLPGAGMVWLAILQFFLRQYRTIPA